MNELSQLTGLLDAKWAHVGTLITITLMIGGRVYKSLATGGGILGVFHSLLYGAPKPPPTDKEKNP
jgi:hypothetical protein